MLFNTRIFDDFIAGSGSVYSAEDLSPMLGQADSLVVMAVVDQVSTSLTFTLDIEHGGQQRTYVPKYPSAVISTTVDGTKTWVLTASDPGFLPSLAFVRLRLSVSTGTAHARVMVTGRSWSSPQNVR